MLKKIAVIRKDTARTCPFGLPIPTACKNAGSSVDRMQALEEVDKEKRDRVRRANRRIYVHSKDGQRCPYADKIVEEHDSVHCDYGEGGERLRDFPLRPSPFYPRVFSGLGQTGLFAYPVDYYWDNPQARNLFTGIFSIYASTGEINIQKVAIKPDPVLAELTENIAIKEE